MGKNLIIPGADFSENGMLLPIFGIPDEQFLTATSNWNLGAYGFALLNQQVLKNRTLHGMRVNVHTAGVLKIYKGAGIDISDQTTIQQIATATTGITGIQNIDFNNEIQLTDSEFLIFGQIDDGSTLIPRYTSATYPELIIVQNPAYIYVGTSSVRYLGAALNVDLY